MIVMDYACDYMVLFGKYGCYDTWAIDHTSLSRFVIPSYKIDLPPRQDKDVLNMKCSIFMINNNDEELDLSLKMTLLLIPTKTYWNPSFYDTKKIMVNSPGWTQQLHFLPHLIT